MRARQHGARALSVTSSLRDYIQLRLPCFIRLEVSTGSTALVVVQSELPVRRPRLPERSQARAYSSSGPDTHTDAVRPGRLDSGGKLALSRSVLGMVFILKMTLYLCDSEPLCGL